MFRFLVLIQVVSLLLLASLTASAGQSPYFPNLKKQRLAIADLTQPVGLTYVLNPVAPEQKSLRTQLQDGLVVHV